MAITRPFSDGMPHAWPLPVQVPQVPGQGNIFSGTAARKRAFIAGVP